MADTGQSVIGAGDCEVPLVMEVADSTTSGPVVSTLVVETNDQYEVSSTTDDGLNITLAAQANAGNGNKTKQPTTTTTAGAGAGVGAAPTTRAGGVSKFHQFRAPQQCVQQKKKMWNKRQKCHHHLKYLHHAQQLQQQQLQHHQQQQQTAASKADLENIQNIKNQIGHHRLAVGVCAACGIEAGNNNSQQIKNPKQQVYKKMISHRPCNGGGGGCTAACNGVGGNNGNGAPPLAHHPVFCPRSKFFLPDKRPRKEVIIPPTKFLLGGNISDPLNLNSLQNEANSSNNNTPATTPRQSPITTPPKVEVIIPPNIHDPLHLLDPVDTMEYEKQLTSPMKRKSKSSKSKNRHRKKKTKRRRFVSVNSTLDDYESERCIVSNNTLSTDSKSNSIASDSCLAASVQHNSSAEFTDKTGESSEIHGSCESIGIGIGEKAFDCDGVCIVAQHSSAGGIEKLGAAAVSDYKVLPTLLPPAAGTSNDELQKQQQQPQQQQQQHPTNKNHSNITVVATSDRDTVKKDLRLDLSGVAELQQQHFFNHHHQHHNNSSMCTSGGSGSASSGCGGRKRKASEGACSGKNKFRRLDSMDKIVSPVVPQPGAWKRPPRLVPTGARKISRHRSTSFSETELLSPVDDSKTITDSESIRPDTPDIDSLLSKHGDTASIGSPLSTASAKTIDNTSITGKLSAPQQEDAAAAAPAATSIISSTTTTTTTITATSTSTSTSNPSTSNINNTNNNNDKMPKFRPDGAKYQYGNYDRYSGYRHLNEFMDVRLQVFQRNAEFFRGKDILDIGCNVGHMTITVARNLAPKSILGIDIDKNLIARARKNLSMYVRIPKAKVEPSAPLTRGPEEEPQKGQKGTKQHLNNDKKKRRNTNNNNNNNNNNHHQLRNHHHHHHHHHHFHHGYFMHQHPHQNVEPQNLFPASFPLTYGGIPEVNRQLQPEMEPSSNSNCGEFPKNVFFRQTNYVLKDEALLNNDTQQYDLIVCLSVTKWIHLNFGDNGLKMAFKRMFNQLRPGGKLILEAQNWASYKKKKNLTETIYNNYRNIEFFPNKFHEYLLSNEVGFSHSYTLGVPRHMSKGFCRPIQLYAKGDFTPNHVRWSDAYNPQTPYEAYRGIYATMPRQPHPIPSAYNTPCGGNSGSYSCRQTPMHQPTSQYYNPLETDSYLPSYDIEVLNQLYVFASPLYQTVWSPPASMRNSSSHTPLFGSVRDIENEESCGGGASFHRHVYPPNDEISSPNANGAFNSIRDADTDDSQTHSVVRHVYANCESSSSPHVNDSETQDGLEEPTIPHPPHRNPYEQNGCTDSNES